MRIKTGIVCGQLGQSHCPETVVVTADRQESNGPVRHLVGHVTFETEAMILRADKAEFNENTQEIVAQGDVRVKLK